MSLRIDLKILIDKNLISICMTILWMLMWRHSQGCGSGSWKRSFFCGSGSAKTLPLPLPHRREEWREKRNWFGCPSEKSE